MNLNDCYNFDDFKRFIISDYLKKNSTRKNIFLYDAEISTYALNKNFYTDKNFFHYTNF